MMFFRNKMFVVLSSLFVVLFAVVALFVNHHKPVYKGILPVFGIGNNVSVYFDAIGVPHIEAQTQKDVYTALGYVHAQDRLWQMELLRRIAAGRLSEMFGEKTIEVDKFFKSLGIEAAAQKTMQELDTTTAPYVMTQAYLAGINQFIKEGATPVEFYLLGLEKETYQLKDVYNVFGYMAFSFAMAHKTDPMLSSLKSKLGVEYLRDLPVEIDSLTTSIIGNSKSSKQTAITASINRVLKLLPAPMLVGSNAWVVGPKKTAHGKVIFENDPHIGFAQPAVWYQAHLKTPNFESYGFHLGLTPFPMLAHNRDYAYGITMFENDDIDFYQEKQAPDSSSHYVYKGQELPYKTSKHTIHVKDDVSVDFEVKETIHGPIVNDVISEIGTQNPVSMYWVYTQEPNKLLKASYGMSHAVSMEDFEKTVSLIHAPGLNMMYGDTVGNVAWWAAGKLVEHSNSVNPKFILNGEDGEDDQLNTIDFSENPHAINPKSGFVYSANNQSFAIIEKEGLKQKKGYHGYYLPEDRGRRIVELLTPSSKVTKEAMMEMTLDVTSSTALEFVSHFPLEELAKSSSENVAQAVAYLQNWNGDFMVSSVAATIYMKLIYVYLEATLKDEMGSELFNQFLNTHIQKRTIGHLIGNENSLWWDDITTSGVKESRSEVLTTAFSNTISDLENQLGLDMTTWKWGRVHTVEHKHPIGEVALFRSFLNVGPFETNGGNEVLNNLQYDIDSTGVYKVKSGPSTRRVIDFSDIENSKGIIPTGQSGNPFSKHYKDQSDAYLKGKFFTMLLDFDEIKKSNDTLVLTPVSQTY